jgi:hypothetical protein
LRRRRFSGKRQRRSLAGEDPLPKSAPGAGTGEPAFDQRAERAGECGERAQPLGQGAVEPLPQQARQHRRGAAGCDRHHHRRAIDDRRHDEAAQRGLVHDVDRKGARPGCARHGRADRRDFARHDHQCRAVEQRRRKILGKMDRLAAPDGAR